MKCKINIFFCFILGLLSAPVQSATPSADDFLPPVQAKTPEEQNKLSQVQGEVKEAKDPSTGQIVAEGKTAQDAKYSNRNICNIS